uniref:Transcription factor COE helix-loop-helix domain-containing protein n=1 Tax=Timema tahoe TaxID=61484 RepID=A0A7R9FEE0_9NEOP|nr:unnamed protein product [Timema tahoe]
MSVCLSADHVARDTSADTAQAHPRRRRSDALLQVKTVLQGRPGQIRLRLEHFLRCPKSSSEHFLQCPKCSSIHFLQCPIDHFLQCPKCSSDNFLQCPSDHFLHCPSENFLQCPTDHFLQCPKCSSIHFLQYPIDYFLHCPKCSSIHFLQCPIDHFLQCPKSSTLNEPTIDYGFQRLQKLIPRHPGDPEKLPKEIILKRAADLAEALYSMPRNNQLALSAPRSPSMPNNGMSAGFNTYTGQLAVSVQENGNEEYGRGQSSSVSPRGGGYGSSASTPHSSNGGGSYVTGTSTGVTMNGSYTTAGVCEPYGGVPQYQFCQEKSAFSAVARPSGSTPCPQSATALFQRNQHLSIQC